ncbi:hypothetical protein CCACVL1_18964 [Corchorus capsularis]|uniref:FBD domain-containing protein n=1 Tax=Corchorus capsularis TaxID=210143 RepID=A0A1R3HJ47_COCAP|nr:hypothetical protein CCACVL1_18964 [Corchorus capsularis]
MANPPRTRKRVHATIPRRAPDGSAFKNCDTCGETVAIALAGWHECENKKKELKRFKGVSGIHKRGMHLDFPENIPQLTNLKQLDLKVTEYKYQSILPCLELIEACPMLSRLKMKTSLHEQFQGSLDLEWKSPKESHKSLELVEMVGFLINLIHNTVSLKTIIIDAPKEINYFNFTVWDYKVEARKFADERLKMALKMTPSVEVVIK